ncbi:MAG: glycerol-3-phosphate acyltransferase [Candidatus Izemoplasmataceae bacterium]
MIALFLIVGAYVVGMIPNAYVLQVFLDKEKLGHVRSDKVGSYDVYTHIKEPEFYMTVMLDLFKGASVVFLASQLSNQVALPAFLLLVTVIARNFNVIIGIRNGIGITIILGGLLVYAPLIVLIYTVVVLVFYSGVHDLDTSLTLGTVVIPITLAFTVDSLLVLLIGFALVMAIFVHKFLYIRAAAFRTRHADHHRDNPFSHIK